MYCLLLFVIIIKQISYWSLYIDWGHKEITFSFLYFFLYIHMQFSPQFWNYTVELFELETISDFLVNYHSWRRENVWFLKIMFLEEKENSWKVVCIWIWFLCIWHILKINKGLMLHFISIYYIFSWLVKHL